MAKGAYVGVDNKARKIKNIYLPVSGVARKAKKGHVGVNGVARVCYEITKKWNKFRLEYGQTNATVASSSYALTISYYFNLTEVYGHCEIDTKTGEVYKEGKIGSITSGSGELTVFGYNTVYVAADYNVMQETPYFYKVHCADGLSTIGHDIVRLRARKPATIEKITRTGPTQGEYIETVEAAAGAYPDNGEKDGYWYVKV